MLDFSNFFLSYLHVSSVLDHWYLYIETGHDFYLVTNKQSISTDSSLHCLFTFHDFLSQKYSGKMSLLQRSQPSPPLLSCYSWAMLLLPTFHPTGWTDQHHPWPRASLLCWSQKSDLRSPMISHASIWQWTTFFSLQHFHHFTFRTLFSPELRFSLFLQLLLLSLLAGWLQIPDWGDVLSWVLCAALFSF